MNRAAHLVGARRNRRERSGMGAEDQWNEAGLRRGKRDVSSLSGNGSRILVSKAQPKGRWARSAGRADCDAFVPIGAPNHARLHRAPVRKCLQSCGIECDG